MILDEFDIKKYKEGWGFDKKPSPTFAFNFRFTNLGTTDAEITLFEAQNTDCLLSNQYRFSFVLQ